MEKWKKLPSIHDRYEVSTYGRVRSWAVMGSRYKTAEEPSILSQYTHRTGHRIVGISVDGNTKQKRVHRLVAKAFIPNPNNYPYVLHNDDNPENNHISNLRWGDNKMNQSDRRKNNGHHNEGEHHGLSKLKDDDVIEIKKRIYLTDDFYKDIANDYGVSDRCIRAIKDGFSWAHIQLDCEKLEPPKRRMTYSKHHMAKKYRHKKTGKIFNSGKEAAIWADVNYATMISRINRGSDKSQFEKI